MLYVCFDDSVNNPTYAPLDTTFIVEGPDTYDNDSNPCNHFHHLDHAPVCPIDHREAYAFAQLMGWEYVIENGRVCFRTNIAVPIEQAPRVDVAYTC